MSSDNQVILPQIGEDSSSYLVSGELSYSLIESVPIAPEYTAEDWQSFIEGDVQSGEVLGMWSMDAWVKEDLSAGALVSQEFPLFEGKVPMDLVIQNNKMKTFFDSYKRGALSEWPALSIYDLVHKSPQLRTLPMSAYMACHRIGDVMRILPYEVLGVLPVLEFVTGFGNVYRWWAFINIQYTPEALALCNSQDERFHLSTLRFLDQKMVYSSIAGLDRDIIDELAYNQSLGYLKSVALDTYPPLRHDPVYGDGQMFTIVVGAVILILVVVAAATGGGAGAFLIAVGA